MSGCTKFNCAKCSRDRGMCDQDGCKVGFLFNPAKLDCTGSCDNVYKVVIKISDLDAPRYVNIPSNGENAVIQFDCGKGYEVHKSSTRSCINGKWIHEGKELDPKCDPVPPPSDLALFWDENGHIMKVGLPIVGCSIIILILSMLFGRYVFKLRRYKKRLHEIEEQQVVHGAEMEVFQSLALPTMSSFGKIDNTRVPDKQTNPTYDAINKDSRKQNRSSKPGYDTYSDQSLYRSFEQLQKTKYGSGDLNTNQAKQNANQADRYLNGAERRQKQGQYQTSYDSKETVNDYFVSNPSFATPWPKRLQRY